MTKLVKTALVATALMFAGTTALQADVAKGQKLYQKKLKKMCDVSGSKFAALHSQAEWEDAKDEGTLIDLFVEGCPKGEAFIKGDKFKERYMEHIYDFVYEYANDSGNVPAC